MVGEVRIGPRLGARLVRLGIVLSVASAAPLVTGSTASSQALPKSPLITAIQKRGVIRVGVATTPPFILENPATSTYEGPGATLANDIAASLHVKIKWVGETYNTIIAALQAHQIDLADAPLYETPQRLKVINMSGWAKDGFCYLVQKTSFIHSTAQINSSKVTMGNIIGTGTYTETAAKYPKAKEYTRVAAPGEQALIPELLSGRVNVDPVDATLVQVYLSEYHSLRVVPSGCSPTHGEDLPTAVAVGYNKGDAGFAAFVNKVIKAHQETLNRQLIHFSEAKYMSAGVKP